MEYIIWFGFAVAISWFVFNYVTRPTDRYGNAYARVGDLHAGDVVWLYDSFPCVENYESNKLAAVFIASDESSGLFFLCMGPNEGTDGPCDERHYLDGQEEEETGSVWWRLGARRRYYTGIYASKPTKGFEL